MLKRHCDLCDSVIKNFQTQYNLVKKTHKMFIYEAESTELEICEKCLDEIIKRKNEKCEVEQ